MIARRFRSWWLPVALVGCGVSQPSGGPPSAPPGPAALRAPTASPSARPPELESTPLRTTIQLEPAAVPSLLLPKPKIEVQRPTFGEVIEAPLARRYEIRLEISGYVITRDGQGAILSLDGRRPRRWPAEGALMLGDLLPEDEDLVDGAHSLLVVLVDAEGGVLRGRTPDGQSPFFLVDFSIGRAAKPPDASRIFCLSPAGTYYAKDGPSARVELFPVGPVNSSLRLRVEGSGMDAWTEVHPEQPYVVAGLPFGDVRFTAFRGDTAVARCVITVNPEKSP